MARVSMKQLTKDIRFVKTLRATEEVKKSLRVKSNLKDLEDALMDELFELQEAKTRNRKPVKKGQTDA